MRIFNSFSGDDEFLQPTIKRTKLNKNIFFIKTSNFYNLDRPDKLFSFKISYPKVDRLAFLVANQ